MHKYGKVIKLKVKVYLIVGSLIVPVIGLTISLAIQTFSYIFYSYSLLSLSLPATEDEEIGLVLNN